MSCDKSLNKSKENKSKENKSKENESKENESKENERKENKSKENKSKENESKENESKENESIKNESLCCVKSSNDEQNEQGKQKQTTVSDILKLYNNICVSLERVNSPRLKTVTMTNILCLLDKYKHFDFKAFFEKVENSDFLTGRSNRWKGGGAKKAGFDWIIKPENVEKILSGKYDNYTYKDDTDDYGEF